MDLNLNSRIKLNNGTEIPVFGFGTYKLTGEKTVKESVNAALESGYRLIDTAQMYGNEQYVGEAVRESGIPREEILANPCDLAISSEGFIYILDSRDNNIKVFKKDGAFIKCYGQQGQGPGDRLG